VQKQSHAAWAYINFLIGPVLFFYFFWINPLALAPTPCKVLAVAAMMIVWWITEAIPMPVVALLPLVIFPLLGISKFSEVANSYSNEVIFLFMGGFMIGLGIEKWNLHKRIALNIIRFTGTGGNKILLGFIFSTGLISMWLSNTATTMMMFPIAVSVIAVVSNMNISTKRLGTFHFVSCSVLRMLPTLEVYQLLLELHPMLPMYLLLVINMALIFHF